MGRVLEVGRVTPPLAESTDYRSSVSQPRDVKLVITPTHYLLPSRRAAEPKLPP